MRILHLADLHLGFVPEFLGEKKDERAAERNELLKRAVDYALDKRNEIKAVVVAGDLFESHRPASNLVEDTISQLARLEKGGIFTLTVPGNHDEITYSDSVYRQQAGRWPGVLVKNPGLDEVARVEIDGKKVSFAALAYTGGITVTNPPVSAFPKLDADIKIAVLHGSIDWDAGDRSLPVSSAAIATSGYDCIALGHIHAHSLKYYGPTAACYAGACEAKGFDDPGCGHFTVLNINDRTTVTKVPAAARPCLTKKLDLGGYENLDEVIEAVKNEANPAAMMRIKLEGQTSFRVDTEIIKLRCRDYFYHISVEGDGMFLDVHMIDSLASEPNIRGYYVKMLQDRLEKAQDESEKRIIQKALLRGLAALQAGEML